MVKRAALQLLREENAVFTSSFEHNKRILGNLMPSKPIRNKVAGYIARLIKMKSKVRKLKATKEGHFEKEKY